MIGFVLARRYAKAVIDLAQQAGRVSEVGEELARMAQVFEQSPELVHFFTDPTVRPGNKEKVLEDLMGKGGIKDLTRQFVGLLLTKGRILGIHEIAAAYRDLADEMENRVRARIQSAVPLEDGELEQFRKVLSGISGKEVEVEVEVNEDLVGGIVTQVGSEVYDGSLRNQLLQVKENLSKGR